MPPTPWTSIEDALEWLKTKNTISIIPRYTHICSQVKILFAAILFFISNSDLPIIRSNVQPFISALLFFLPHSLLLSFNPYVSFLHPTLTIILLSFFLSFGCDSPATKKVPNDTTCLEVATSTVNHRDSLHLPPPQKKRMSEGTHQIHEKWFPLQIKITTNSLVFSACTQIIIFRTRLQITRLFFLGGLPTPLDFLIASIFPLSKLNKIPSKLVSLIFPSEWGWL